MKWLFIVVAVFNIAFLGYNLFLKETKTTSLFNSEKTQNHQLTLLSELGSVELNKRKLDQTINQSYSQSSPKEFQYEIKKQGVESMTTSWNVVYAGDKTNSLNSASNIQACYKLGPFEKKQMDEIRLILEEQYQQQLSFQIDTTSVSTYYRIYIPPLENKDKIKEILLKLDRNNLKDHYVMSIGGRKNAIAMGVFKKRSAAEKVANRALSIGLSTTIESISDDKKSLYTLQVKFQEDHDLLLFEKLIKKKNLKYSVCKNKG